MDHLTRAVVARVLRAGLNTHVNRFPRAQRGLLGRVLLEDALQILVSLRSACADRSMIILSSILEVGMARTERVTVTLPVELVESIDRFERNRSRFIAEAVGHELVRRRRAELLRSLEHPHPEAGDLAETSLLEWGASLPADDDLVDMSAGKPVRWVEGQGWVEESA